LREYQKEAIAAWLVAPNNGRGILKMATGSGKTFTASKAIEELRAKLLPEGSLLVLITAPTKVLVEQWGKALQHLNPLLCYEDVNQWYQTAESYIQSLHMGIRQTVVLIATEHTFGLTHLRDLVDGWDGKLLFIADEVHGYASRTMRQRLPQKAVYRLGLSATPESKWPEHNEALFAYFGGIVFTYTLGEAIRDGYLSEYNYHPKIAVLTTEELEEHKKYSVQVARFAAKHNGPPPANHPDYKGFMAAVGKRDAVLDQCDSKIDLFLEAIRQRSDSFFQLVYCGPGKSPLREISQFDQAKIYLAQTLELSIHDFVADTPTNLRPRILDDFGRGITIKVLIAKECLDEGVDIPDARIAYLLASSDDPRQWTQRRGRILRLPSTGTKTAEILDFLTLPPKDDSEQYVEIVKSELQRALAFAADAKNSTEVNQQLDDWLTSYQMTREMIIS
jgi:superfamily II DNA or RNA helicase